jgi:xanthine dehydrogenase D subunit
VDLTDALSMSGVHAVLTHEDVPGEKYYGLDHPDQPVLAIDQVRYHGEPVAIVAANHPEIARRAAAAIRVDYEILPPITSVEAALAPDADPLHPGGNLVRYLPIRVGQIPPTADVVVTGEYEIGMQDQAFLGPESGLAIPADVGGVDIHIATQWLHADRKQIAACLGLAEDDVQLILAGVGGAFGAREDLSMQVHAAMLALHTGKPVKMVYGREESFFGHVHRHPAVLRYEHGAHADGRLAYVKATMLLDGGAYASTSKAVCGNAASLGVGPYVVPNVAIDAYAAYTNNPPCGAMRGFGAVQACFAYESQMDKLAQALGIDPVEMRARNALSTGDRLPTGQLVEGPAPVAELLHRVRDAVAAPAGFGDVRELPGGSGFTTTGEGVVRGVGYAVGIKNICFSEGFDDFSTARVRLSVIGGEPAVLVHTAAAEVGQGLVTVQGQIARTELGVSRVDIATADTTIGSAGSSSASRQTYVTGGAVREACAAVRAKVLALAGVPDGIMRDGMVHDAAGDPVTDLVRLLGDTVIEETREYRHRPTVPLDPLTGQGDSHTQLAFAAHRATVDVDVELGLVRVVEIVTAQDVGKAMNPLALAGQIHGGTVQGLGLALMEEIQMSDGKVRNPSFTDYLIPTIADVPPMHVQILELADPHAPYGLRGVGEPPTISSTPAIVAAIRAATGRPLTRVPVRPEHITS